MWETIRIYSKWYWTFYHYFESRKRLFPFRVWLNLSLSSEHLSCGRLNSVELDYWKWFFQIFGKNISRLHIFYVIKSYHYKSNSIRVIIVWKIIWIVICFAFLFIHLRFDEYDLVEKHYRFCSKTTRWWGATPTLVSSVYTVRLVNFIFIFSKPRFFFE